MLWSWKGKNKEENLKSITLFEVKDKQCIIHYSTIQREGILVSLPKEIGFKNNSCGRDLSDFVGFLFNFSTVNAGAIFL